MRGLSITRRRRISGNVLIGVGGIALIGSAIAKFAHVPKLVSQMAAIGFDDRKLMFIATLEVLSTVVFLLPATRWVGLLTVSSYLGGAIATHLQHDLSLMQPSIILAIIWIGVWLRHPEAQWSLNRFAGTNRDTIPAQSKGALEQI